MVNHNSTLYSKKHNFEFYNIHKNGQSSIIKTFGLEWCPIETLPKDRKIICILRDPIERLISSFFYTKFKHKRTNIQSGINISKFVRPKNPNEGFKLFIGEIKNRGFFDDHVLPQIDFINNNIKTKYGKYKHMANRDLNNVTHFINIKNMKEEMKKLFGIDILHENSTHGKKNFKLTDHETIRLIKEIYAEDFKLYEKVKS